MDMSKEANEVVLCVSNAYQKKFYLNENFNGLPQSIRDELKIMCVIYTEDIGGVLELVFDEAGNLELRTSCEEGDFCYDEIGSVLKIKQLQQRKKGIAEALEMYYKVLYLGRGLRGTGRGGRSKILTIDVGKYEYYRGVFQGDEIAASFRITTKNATDIG